METIASRLRKARKAAHYDNASDAARAFGWPVSTYLGHENGDRVPKRATVEKYARAFRVNVAWLLTGIQNSPVTRTVPVYGEIGLGDAIHMLDTTDHSPLSEIELPYGFSVPNCGALIARGNSQYPRVKDGEVVIYHSGDLLPEDLIGQDSIVGLRDGRVMLKTLRRGRQAGRYHLESHNAPTIEDAEVEWVGQLLSIVPAGQWRKLR